MTNLIPRDAAIAAVTQADKDCRGAHGARENIRAIPTIDPAAIREAAMRDVLDILESYGAAGEAITEEILALIGEKK